MVEPERLILAWQAPDLAGSRYRWAVGEIIRRAHGHGFRYFLEGAEFRELNDEQPFLALREAGYAGYPAFTLGPSRFEHDVMSAFRRRLPARGRADYADYLEHFRLTPDIVVSDFALLGLTGAKLPSDGFSVVDPIEDARPARDLFLEVAGYRHYSERARLKGGESVTFAAEPRNAIDQNAVVLRVDDRTIGYINRLRTRAFRSWVADGRLTGWVERLNGRPERPRAFIFVQVAPEPRRAAA